MRTPRKAQFLTSEGAYVRHTTPGCSGWRAEIGTVVCKGESEMIPKADSAVRSFLPLQALRLPHE